MFVLFRHYHPTMKTILSLLLFVWTLDGTLAAYSSDVTCKAKEWLCGDQCVQYSFQCQCGSNSTSLLPDKICCNTQPCIKNDNYTQCPDGIVQNEDERCNDMCKTSHSNFRTIWCPEKQKCMKDQQVTGFCKGQQICSEDPKSNAKTDDSEFCTNVPPKGDYCIEGEEKTCPQVPGRSANYQNRECAKNSVTTRFHCLNRMDQVDVLFSPHFTKGQEINLNQLLEYNDEYLQCNEHKVNWKLNDWADVVDINDDYCVLKDKKTKIQLRSLYQKIQDDHSFQRRDLAQIMGDWTKEFVLKQNCFETGIFLCNEGDRNECIPNVQTCDGIPQCSNGRDEDLDLCRRSSFPPTATKECLKPDVYNLDIKILAVPCNRIEECSNGEDEADCKLQWHITFVVLLAGFLVIVAISVYMLYTATLEDYEEEVNFEELLREHGFESKHTISYLTMLQSVEHKLRVQINQRYYQAVLIHCNSKALSIIWLKDNLDAFTLDNVMGDLGDLSIFGKAKVLMIKIIRGIPMRIKFKGLPLMIIKPFTHYLDVVRDILVVIQVGHYLQSGNTFLSCAFGSLLGCLVVPFGLSTLRLLLNNVDIWKQGKWVYKLLVGIILFPFIPVILLCYENITTLKLEHGKLDKLTTYCDQYKRVKAQTSKFIRTELGLETLLQMSLALVLLLYARSSTRTTEGLEAIFDKNAVLGLDPLIVATLGVLWGVVSIFRSYMYGIQCVKDYFPIKAKGIVGLYSIITIVIKAGVIVLFFTPALGLFDLLKHLQGESLPYNVVMENGINTEVEYMFYSKAKPILWSQITRLDYSDPMHPQPPSSTLYSGFTIGEYFIIFWIIILLHPLLIMAVKKLFNPTNFEKQSYLDRIIHAMENTQIPAPMNDWDEGPGSVKVHKKRRKTVEIEIAMTILANFLVHCLMLFPLEILGKPFENILRTLLKLFCLFSAKRVHQRHSILEQTIGALPEEIEAYDTIRNLSPLMFLALIILTLVQLALYLVFNRFFHPFKEILSSEDSEPIVQSTLQSTRKMSTISTVSVMTAPKGKSTLKTDLDTEALASNEAFRTMLEEQVKIAVATEVSEKMQELEIRLESNLKQMNN